MTILPDRAEILHTALEYHKSGFSIVPILFQDKRPTVRWKRYQQKRPDLKTVEHWFAGATRNIGIVCGPVSGNLAVRDFDRQESYDNWAKAHSDLATTLPTVETARGRHVYFRADLSEISNNGSRIRELGDGELRGGGYCLAPPSIHPSGHRYRANASIVGGLPQLILKETGFLECWSSPSSSPPADPSDTADTLHVSQDSVQSAIRGTLPTGPGQRNRCVFQFARRLKALAPNLDPVTLLPVVTEWHRRALPVIRTKSFSETWADFLIAWDRICTSTENQSLREIVDSADSFPIPRRAGHHDDPRVLRLIQICAALQQAAGDKPFFLSCRKAGELVGASKSDANRMLRMLCAEGILRLDSRGNNSTKQASEYRYCG